MKKLKRTKVSNGDDIMSKLPDDILVLILSRGFSINEVVRTSIISKRWRYICKSIPSFPFLNIDCSRRLLCYGNYQNNKKFIKFVDWALANKTNLDLHTFSLSCLNCYDMKTIYKWIQAAVTRKVKSLDLMVRTTFDPEPLPQCMVNCDSLESLNLVLHYSILILPDSAKLPALRVLKLHMVYFSDHNLIERFLNICPLLEDFSLINCAIGNLDHLHISCPTLKTLRIHSLTFFKNSSLVVSCPKLVVLEYVRCRKDYLLLENLHSLKEAALLCNDLTRPNLFSYQLGNDICQLLAVISHVESLSLNNYFIQAIYEAPNPERNLPASFPYLKTLKLTTTVDAFTMNAIIRILECSPNLNSLHLIIQEELLMTEYWKLDEVETMRMLTRHLKRVEILEFNGEKAKLDIPRFLLEHGKALEEIVFSWHDNVKYRELSMKTVNEMSKFRKASSTVKLTATLVKEE